MTQHPSILRRRQRLSRAGRCSRFRGDQTRQQRRGRAALGRHRRHARSWSAKSLAEAVDIRANERVLDVAAGTATPPWRRAPVCQGHLDDYVPLCGDRDAGAPKPTACRWSPAKPMPGRFRSPMAAPASRCPSSASCARPTVRPTTSRGVSRRCARCVARLQPEAVPPGVCIGAFKALVDHEPPPAQPRTPAAVAGTAAGCARQAALRHRNAPN